jgi:hypothetical protein
MGFSSILDISSFFIGMIINLIFVALMCYYFKRKYDYLYEAQCEQSKILYQLLQKPSNTLIPNNPIDFTCDPLVHVKCSENTCESDRDSDSDSDSETESVHDKVHEKFEDITIHELEVKDLDVTHLNEATDLTSKSIQLDRNDTMLHVTVEEVKDPEPFEVSIQLDQETVDTNYSKMSMKQLKELLSSKGIKPKNNIRKEELIELITHDETMRA